MRIDAEHADTRIVDAELAKRRRTGDCRAFDEIRRQPFQRAVEPLMQGDMNDAEPRADQHEEHRIGAGALQFRQQVRIARETPPARIDGGLRMRTGHDRPRRAVLHQFDGFLDIGDRRAAAGGRRPARRDVLRRDAVDLDEIDAAIRRAPRGAVGLEPRAQPLGDRCDEVAVADDDGPERRVSGQRMRGLHGHFRPDPVGVANGDQNPAPCCFHQSGKPSSVSI